MNSFKTATAEAAHAVLFEKVDDLRFDTSSVDARVARLENDLRKRLRSMRKRDSTSRNSICMEKRATRRYISELRAEHSRDLAVLRSLETRLADVFKSYELGCLPSFVPPPAPEPRRPCKRARLVKPMVDVFQREEIACSVIPFLTAVDAFGGLACASRAHRRITRRWFPRLVSKTSTLPPYHWNLEDLKGVTTIRATHVRDIDRLAGRLVDLHSARFPLGFTLQQVCALDWSRLEVLSLPSVLPFAFWMNFSPARMPRLRQVTLAWDRSGNGDQLITWIGRVRELMDAGKLNLETFPTNLTFDEDSDAAFDNYLEIHRRIGTTSFYVDTVIDPHRFCSAVGHAVEKLVVTTKIGPLLPSLGWVIDGRLPRLHTLVLSGVGNFGGHFDVADGFINHTISSLTVRLSGPETCVRKLLSHLGGLRHLTLNVWNVRTVISTWAIDHPPWMDTLERLDLLSAGRYVYSIPYIILPRLKTVTAGNLTDTQTYCLLADVGRVGPRVTLRLPCFVTNKVASMLRAYESDDRCNAIVEIKGYQSEFFVLLGGERMRKVRII